MIAYAVSTAPALEPEPTTRCLSRRSALWAAVCLVPFLVSACGTTKSATLFSLRVTGTLAIGHYDIPPVYRYLVLHWRYPCGGGSAPSIGIRIDAFRGGGRTKRWTARAVLSKAYVVRASQAQAPLADKRRIAIHRADYIVLSVGAPTSQTAYYDLSTRCAYDLVVTGERRQ